MSNERVDRLEERLAWLEKHVGEQDRVMLEMQETLTRLKDGLLQLQRRAPQGDSAGAGEEDPAADRPPHY